MQNQVLKNGHSSLRANISGDRRTEEPRWITSWILEKRNAGRVLTGTSNPGEYKLR